MQAKVFLTRMFMCLLLALFVLVGLNWYIDLYGLFRPSNGRTVSIYSDERTSKYLLAHRYVPENFSTYILGPSLSANLDPSAFSDLGIYNFSMMGANITEQKAVLDKALEVATPRAVIICLHPYLTMDHGMKTGMINPKEYWGALGSFSLYKAYGLRIVRAMNLLPGKFPEHQFNTYGNNDYEAILKVASVKERIEEELKLPGAVDARIDTVALQEFDDLIRELKAKDVKIIGYFHPLPLPIFNRFKAELLSYQQVMRNHLGEDAVIVDFTTSEFDYFTGDLNNYMDHGHLSKQGQQFVLNHLIKHIPNH